MFALNSRQLRRLSVHTSGSARRRVRERRREEQSCVEEARLALARQELRRKEKFEKKSSFLFKIRGELASYEPWGRAGAGAPNTHGIRFCNLRAAGIYPEDELKGVSAHERGWRWSSLRQRRRTPLRLREDPQLRYADLLRRTVDNDIRYRQSPHQQQAYKKILATRQPGRGKVIGNVTDDMVNKRKKALDDEIKRNLEYERKMQTMDGPWGKPGPGGTTWRHPRDIGLNFSKSMGWTDNEIFNKIKGEHKICKTSLLVLPKVNTADAESKHDASNKENAKSNIDKLPNIEKEPNRAEREQKSNSALLSKKKKQSMSDKIKRSPKKKNFVKILSNGEIMKRKCYDDEQDNGDIISEKKLTPETTILRLTGGIELVPLLARRRRVGARTLPSSDVTRPPEQSCEWRELLDVDYLRDLKEQIQIKSEKKEESRRDSAESVRVHHATWASLWGRPGHGAPQQRGRYARSNLAQLLYVVPIANSNL